MRNILGGRLRTLRIDLNRVRGDRVSTYVEGSTLQPGEIVRVVEEEGDAYLAHVESIQGDRVNLHIDFDTLIPAE